MVIINLFRCFGPASWVPLFWRGCFFGFSVRAARAASRRGDGPGADHGAPSKKKTREAVAQDDDNFFLKLVFFTFFHRFFSLGRCPSCALWVVFSLSQTLLPCFGSYTAVSAALLCQLHCCVSYTAVSATLLCQLHCCVSYTAVSATLLR